MKFKVQQCDGQARYGRLEFARGIVETPAFMPVGTRATAGEIAEAIKDDNDGPDETQGHDEYGVDGAA